MKDLVKKYPALVMPYGYIDFIRKAMDKAINTTKFHLTESDRDYLYGCFKLNISCIGLEPAEYETVIKWFCDTMKY